MKTTATCLLALAVVSTGLLAGCEVDESAPTRPRTQNFFTPDENAQNNAEHRALEKPKRDLPTGNTEFPGQSKANSADPQVITADFHTPVTHYDADVYNDGPIPHIPANPGTAPMVGSTPVPGTGWSIDHAWGQGLTLEDYPHRDWPAMSTNYVSGAVHHNPTYYFNLQSRLPIAQNDGSYGGSWISNLIEVPWFYANSLAVPVLMVIECPFSQRTSENLSHDPNFRGHLPSTGQIVPSPQPGVITWAPFVTGEMNNATQPSTNPTPTTAPDTTPPANFPGQ